MLRRRSIASAVAFLISAAAMIGAGVAEFAVGALRGDGDSAADGLRYLTEAPEAYAASGAALVIGAAALVVGIAGVALVVREGGLTLPLVGASAIGLIAGALLVLAGAIRLQASGSVPYIGALDRNWGESAYLAVHLAGTQGALSAGAYATAGWLLAVAVIAARRRVRWLLVAGVAPMVLFAILLTDVVLPWIALPDALFPVTVAALLGGPPLGLVLLAIALLVPATRESLAAPARGRGT